MSLEKDKIIWEFQAEYKATRKEKTFNFAAEQISILFYPKYNLLLVADGFRQRILIVNSENGCLIQTISLSNMGTVSALILHKDQIVMLHDKAKWTISYLKLSARIFFPSWPNKDDIYGAHH